MKKRRLIIIGVILLITIGFIFFFQQKQSKKEKIKTTTFVKQESLIQSVSASGKIKSEKEVILRFQTSGRLAWVGVKKGDWVKKWQAIASLDKRQLQKSLEKELIDYMNQRWDFEQQHDDYQNDVLTDSIKRILEKAQFDLNRDVLDVEIADLTLKLATIVSPINGIVTEIEAPVAGVNITPATAEFIIADPNEVFFKATIDEVDIAEIREGQKAILVLDSYPDEEVEAAVKQISFQAETSSGGGTVFPVKISLPSNESLRFRLGMNGDAEVVLQEKEAVLTVPASAVLTKKDKCYVFVVKNGKLHQQEVETGLETDREIEIISGLDEGAEIVIEKVKSLKNGQKVK